MFNQGRPRIAKRECATRLWHPDCHALELVTGLRTFRIHVKGEDRTNRIRLEREYAFGGAFVIGCKVAEQTHAFQKQMIGRVRLCRARRR